jgi:peptidoglycan/LPS O-acetylase OafA/YrhL
MGITPVMWTLALEVQFYVLYALVTPAIRRFGLLRLTILWLTFDGVYRLAFEFFGSGAPLSTPFTPSRFAPDRFGEWLLGALLAEQVCNSATTMSPRIPRMTAIGLLMLAVGLAGLAPISKYLAMDMLVSVGFYALLLGEFRSRPAESPRRLTRLLCLLGTISYSLYLTHLPCFSLCRFASRVLLPATTFGIYHQAIASWLFALIVSFGVSMVAFRLVEAPFHSLGRSLSARLLHPTLK